MFTAALFTIVKIWKQAKCSSTDKWIKMCCIHTQWNITQPFYILSFVKAQINLQSIMPSEIGQKGKDKYHMISLFFSKLYCVFSQYHLFPFLPPSYPQSP